LLQQSDQKVVIHEFGGEKAPQEDAQEEAQEASQENALAKKK
jgi:hypothetical protein